MEDSVMENQSLVLTRNLDSMETKRETDEEEEPRLEEDQSYKESYGGGSKEEGDEGKEEEKKSVRLMGHLLSDIYPQSDPKEKGNIEGEKGVEENEEQVRESGGGGGGGGGGIINNLVSHLPTSLATGDELVPATDEASILIHIVHE